MRSIPKYYLTQHAEAGMRARGITKADIEYALSNADSEHLANNDVVINSTLPNGSIIKVRTRPRDKEPALIINAYFLK